MNDKDKEAFDEWVKYNVSIALRDRYGLALIDTWQAACEYMQAELAHYIFKIEAENKNLVEENRALKLNYKEQMVIYLRLDIEKLQTENKKLRDALEYLNTITVLPEKVKPIIREALKEVGEK